MKTKHGSSEWLVQALRQSAPPLTPPDQARIERVCKRLLAGSRLQAEPLRRMNFRPRWRIAAGLMLAAGAALLLRTVAPRSVTGALHLTEVPYLSDLDAWAGLPAAPDTLANESENIMSDIATLTATLNDRSFAILF